MKPRSTIMNGGKGATNDILSCASEYAEAENGRIRSYLWRRSAPPSIRAIRAAGFAR